MHPRLILPNSTYMVTRRCSQRCFFLKPDKAKKVAKAFRYCVARAATLTGVKVHVYCVMSNHYHLIVTDPHGFLPMFTEILNKSLARCLNSLYGRWENFWAGGTAPSYVRLATPAAILEKCAYVLANPVEAGLVATRKDWPGELLEQPGKYRAEKPDWFFRGQEDGGKLPDVGYLELSPPPIADSARESIELIRQATDAREQGVRVDFKARRKRFMGAQAVVNQSIHDNPDTAASRRRLSPTIACRDKWRRIELLQQSEHFRTSYRCALEAWVTG
ncbi:MAG: transposase, partial [Deltaproteobacteria bacterium]|nr:transposase [Deltaproteobacteria bacterium]